MDKINFKYDKKGYIYDMDIEPEVKKVWIARNVMMSSTTKSFPNVTVLMIGSNVQKINIPNRLFPNVEKVVTSTPYYCSGVNFLAESNINSRYDYTLTNTFCKKADQIIDLKNIRFISDFAFDGCESLNVINTENIKSCTPDAFTGSALKKQPFVNGVKMAGSILIDVDKTADVVELPDADNPVTAFAVDITDVNHMISHGETFFQYRFRYDEKNVPKEVIFDIENPRFISVTIMEEFLHNNGQNSDFMMTENTMNAGGFNVVDNVIYTKDMKELVVASANIDNVKIPDGVKRIGYKAFRKCKIKSIKFPDSVNFIEEAAFEECKSLESVEFGKGISSIGIDAFKRCYNLKSIEIPKTVKVVQANAFQYSGLESITLHEGLKSIHDGAFASSNLKEIIVPASVTYIQGMAFGTAIKHIVLKNYIDISEAVAHNRFNVGSMSGSVVEIEYNGRKMYAPNHVSSYKYIKILADRMRDFFESEEEKDYCLTSDLAYDMNHREYAALAEYDKYHDEGLKKWIKAHAKHMTERFVEDGDGDTLMFMLKQGLISKIRMRKLLDVDGIDDMIIVKSYILQEINKKSSKNSNFRV